MANFVGGNRCCSGCEVKAREPSGPEAISGGSVLSHLSHEPGSLDAV